jgi:uncharacterized membrane protein
MILLLGIKRSLSCAGAIIGRCSWMFFGPLMMLVFFFLCLAVLGMMRGSRGGHAMEILKERYARGEINNAEFENRWLLEA